MALRLGALGSLNDRAKRWRRRDLGSLGNRSPQLVPQHATDNPLGGVRTGSLGG